MIKVEVTQILTIEVHRGHYCYINAAHDTLLKQHGYDPVDWKWDRYDPVPGNTNSIGILYISRNKTLLHQTHK